MAMGQQTADAKRAGARFFGITFQVLAVVALAAAIYWSFRADQAATQFGFGPSSSGFMAAVILVSGAFVACLFAGFGYTLGLLCAIYDRQDQSVNVAGSVTPPPRSDAPTRAPQPSKSPAPEVDEPRMTTTSDWSPAPTPKFAPTSPPQSSQQGGRLREWLTRERHLR